MFTSAEITAWVGQLIWPACRIGAALWLMPLFGNGSLPRHIRLVLTVSLAWLATDIVDTSPAVEPFSAAGLLVCFNQALIGLAFGFILQLWLAVFAFAGQFMSMQMGLAMAVMNDPSSGASTPILGKWLQTFAILIFLSLNGHLIAVDILLESFRTIPLQGGALINVQLKDMAMQGAWLFSAGLIMALPVVISMLLVNLAFGVMNRASPQFNIIALGFPMTLMFGMITLLLTFSSLPDLIINFTDHALLMMQDLSYG
ncbi:flagellar biosynthetic protein FliR [Spongorhabdus nitratireducens]